MSNDATSNDSSNDLIGKLKELGMGDNLGFIHKKMIKNLGVSVMPLGARHSEVEVKENFMDTPLIHSSHNEYAVHKKCSTDAILDVVAVVSNPARFKRRIQLFNEFCARMEQEPRVRLTTVELQLGTRPFETNSKIRLRANSNLWHKENMINIAVNHLPADWEYVGVADSDIEFVNKNWVSDTIEALQTYKIVQPWSHCNELGPDGETLQIHRAFCYLYMNGVKITANPKQYDIFAHTGYFWAFTRRAWDEIGGLMDWCVLGSCDWHLGYALIGRVAESYHKDIHPNYKMLCNNFQERCERHIKRNIGAIKGTIFHHFHGSKVDRQYNTRWKVLVDSQFDPLRDIKKNSCNLWELEDNKYALRDELELYFRRRNEDTNINTQDYNYMKKHWL